MSQLDQQGTQLQPQPQPQPPSNPQHPHNTLINRPTKLRPTPTSIQFQDMKQFHHLLPYNEQKNLSNLSEASPEQNDQTLMDDDSGTGNENGNTNQSNDIRRSFMTGINNIVYANFMGLVRLTVWISIVCLSAFMVGNAIFLSAVAEDSVYRRYYHIPDDIGQVWNFCMINGILPLGGILGSFTLGHVLRFTNRRDIAIVHFVGALVSCLITQVPIFQVLLLGRFLLGIVCAWENSIGAILMKDYSPVNYRGFFGSLFFLARVSGITCIFAIGYIYNYQPSDLQLQLINMIPAYLAALQLPLLLLFVPMSPVDLIRRNMDPQFRVYIMGVYGEENFQKGYEHIMCQLKEPTKVYGYINDNRSQFEKEQANIILNQFKGISFFFSLQTSLTRQFCGANYITLYTKYTLKNLGVVHWKIGPLLVNSVQLLACLASFYVCQRYNRKPVHILGCLGGFLGTLVIATCDYLEIWGGVLGAEIWYAIFVGLLLAPTVWPYPFEIIAPIDGRYPTAISWVGAFMLAIVPIRPSSYQFFFAVTVYLLVSEILAWVFFVESKDITLRDIHTQFLEIAYKKIQEQERQQTEEKD